MISLPEPDTSILQPAPLELVVVQVKFDPQPALSAKAALEAKLQLGEAYAHLAPAATTELNIQMGPEGPQTLETKTSGWTLLSRDRRWTVSIFPDSASIECTGYTDWDAFKDRAEALLNLIPRIGSPLLANRLGLRYVNRIMFPDTKQPSDWVGLVTPEALGFAAGADLGEAVASVKTDHHLHLDDCDVVLRTSCAPDNQGPTRHSMLVDTDCFIDSAFAYHINDLTSKIDVLHRRALQVFQEVTTTELRNRLKP